MLLIYRSAWQYLREQSGDEEQFLLSHVTGNVQSSLEAQDPDCLKQTRASMEKELELERELEKELEKERERETETVSKPPSSNIFRVLLKILPGVICIFLLLFGMVGATAVVTIIPSSSESGAATFPIFILYTNAICTFLGCQTAILLGDRFINTQTRLVLFTMVPFGIFIFLVIYSVTRFWLNNIFIICMLGIFAYLASYSNSRCYAISSQVVLPHELSKASLWMNISLYVGVYVGLSVPYWIGHL